MRLGRNVICAVLCVLGWGHLSVGRADEPAPLGVASPQPIDGVFGTSALQSGGPWMSPEGMPESPNIHKKPTVLNTFFRAEYLNLSIQDPGRELLGAPVSNVNDIFGLFPVETEEGFFAGEAQIPNLSSVHFRSIDGVRLTFGWEYLDGGSLELNSFVTENAIKRVGKEVLDSGELFATSVLINGQVSDGLDAPNLFFYNQKYVARYSSRVWGTELNYLWDPAHFWTLFECRLLAGARYINVYEKIQQRGSFLSLFDEFVETSIDTWAYNNVVVPQAGIRLEAVTKYLTFGAEPKFGLGPNFLMGKVRDEHLRGATDGNFQSSTLGLGFATVLDLNSYVRWHATEHLSFSLGFMYTYVAGVLRASKATYYNDSGDLSQPPGLAPQTNRLTDIFWRGLTIGGELTW